MDQLTYTYVYMIETCMIVFFYEYIYICMYCFIVCYSINNYTNLFVFRTYLFWVILSNFIFHITCTINMPTHIYCKRFVHKIIRTIRVYMYVYRLLA